MREFPTFSECLRHAAFQVVSMQTTTGLLTEGFAHWPGALPALLVLLSFVGGCAGSTTGGMKVIRWLVVFRQGVAEIKQLVHPNAEVPVKLAGRAGAAADHPRASAATSRCTSSCSPCSCCCS